jgi:hypothetical protein
MGLVYLHLWDIPTEIVTVLLVQKAQAAWTGTSQIQTLVWTELSNSLHNSEVMVRVLCVRLLTLSLTHTHTHTLPPPSHTFSVVSS